MKGSLRGFSALASAALLLLLAVLVTLAVAEIDQSNNAEERSRRTLDAQEEVWDVMNQTLKAFGEDWRPDEQDWLDFASELSLSPSVEFTDLSSRINLNSINTFVLQDSRLRSTLKDHSVDDFQAYRVKDGPFSMLEGYKDYFDEEALKTLYTTWSVLDVNTVDELMAEKIAALRTGDSSVGSNLRAALQAARVSKRVFDSTSWGTWLGTDGEGLGAVFGVVPEINVNTAPEPILEALLYYPAFELPDPPGKLSVLLSGRKTKPWTPETLASVLGVEKNARILQYLGTESAFLQGSLKVSKGTFRFTLHRLLPGEGKPVIRIVEQGWVP